MGDLLTLMKIMFRHKVMILSFLICGVSLYYLGSGEELVSVQVSPDYFYRLEIYQPRRYQRPFFGFNISLFPKNPLLFLRLYSNLPGNRFFGESEAEDFIAWGEMTSWQLNQSDSVMKGPVVFERVPIIDPVTWQEGTISKTNLFPPDFNEKDINIIFSGDAYICFADGVKFQVPNIYNCKLYPPPFPRCGKELSKEKWKICRIEAAWNYDIAYRNWLNNMTLCEHLEINLGHHSGRVAQDVATIYKRMRCGPYQKANIKDIIKQVQP